MINRIGWCRLYHAPMQAPIEAHEHVHSLQIDHVTNWVLLCWKPRTNRRGLWGSKISGHTVHDSRTACTWQEKNVWSNHTENRDLWRLFVGNSASNGNVLHCTDEQKMDGLTRWMTKVTKPGHLYSVAAIIVMRAKHAYTKGIEYRTLGKEGFKPV